MSWYLHGSGRRHRYEWSMLLAVADSWTASWADHLGFHQEPLPAETPKTTHLGAWASHHWLRVRIDNDDWWAALLVEGDKRQECLWRKKEPIGRPDITRFENWGNARNAKQYKWAEGAENVLKRDDMLQLVPLRQPTNAIFIGDTKTR